MTALHALGLLAAILLAGYLFYALFSPEKL